MEGLRAFRSSSGIGKEISEGGQNVNSPGGLDQSGNNKKKATWAQPVEGEEDKKKIQSPSRVQAKKKDPNKKNPQERRDALGSQAKPGKEKTETTGSHTTEEQDREVRGRTVFC